MSETDDTDDLLLIPPDFFAVAQDLERPYYNIVDTLIQQVSNLQGRIETIESTSDLSLVGSFLDNSVDCSQNMSNGRKSGSSEDLYQPLSTQSTPQKPHTKPKLNSLPASPNIDRFSPRKVGRSPRRPSTSKDGPSLNEIDQFLSKVKTMQKISVARRLDSEFNNERKTTKNEQNVNEIMDELDRQSQKIEERLRIQEKDVGIEEPKAMKLNTWRCGDNIESVPNYDMGVREQLYRNNNVPEKQQRSTEKTQEFSLFSASNMDKSSDSSSDSTQMTAFNRYKYHNTEDRDQLLQSPVHFNALNVLEMHKKLLNNSISSNDTTAKPRGINTISDSSLGFMSLADIWGNKDVTNKPSNLSQKLQEEKLRRQHCEQLIQELQNRNLEMQQKLTVAVKVDDSKNNTLKQYQEALEKAASRMERINKEKSGWEVELTKIKKKYSQEVDELSKKAAYYEKEASKALNLAHGNQEKLTYLENKCIELQNKVEILEKQYKFSDENHQREVEKNKQLSDILGQKEIELSENKNVLNHARTEVAQSKRAVEVCQSEFSSLKNENEKLQDDLQEEKNMVMKLNEQKRLLSNEVESSRSKEKHLQEELTRTKKQLDASNVELKNYYQGQLEVLVQNKLKEFQGQLDQAENRFKDEIKKREMSIAKTAATHIQQISEKYSLEIKLLEEKHHEEARLFKIQLMQYRQENENLQSKLESTKEKSSQLEKQLKQFMEYQWNEALRIFTNNKSPTPLPGESFSTIDQINALKSQSYQNLEEVLSQHNREASNFKKTDLEARSSEENQFDTPVSSRPQKITETDMQKYINLLLNREPGNPTVENRGSNGEKSAWQPSGDNIGRSSGSGSSTNKERKYGKPPWK